MRQENEMTIDDQIKALEQQKKKKLLEKEINEAEQAIAKSVSYTHLTLPTIYSV